MFKSPFFPLPDGLEITAVSESPTGLIVRVLSTRPSSPCPGCSTPSHAIHSDSRRKPADLPCAGRPIRLLLTVRKFFCRVATCPRKVFTERLPDLLEPSSRLTTRLRTAIQEVGFATCGKGGEHLATKLGMPVSDVTVLWSLHLLPLPAIGKVRVVSLDDWSWRRGQRYGSIIVDLEAHKIVDLLPERTVESVIAWLEAHPQVEVVSRDRGGTYADAATHGAPLATQVCDRWHIVKNLGEALEAFLIREHIRLPAAPETESTTERPLSSFSATPAGQGKSQARIVRKWKLSQQVHELHAHGMSLRAIAEQRSLARKTVRQYFRQAPEPPLPTPRPLRASQLDRYEDDLLTRWSQGCHNAAQLAREIRDLGYQGGQTTVRASVAHLRTSTATGSAPRSRKQRAQAVSPRSRRWLLTRDRAHLDQEGQARLDQLLQRSPEVQALHFLAHAFLDMMRERKPVQLRAWMEQASQSGIPELKSLVAGIERDYDAVTACSPPPYSTRRALSISRENR